MIRLPEHVQKELSAKSQNPNNLKFTVSELSGGRALISFEDIQYTIVENEWLRLSHSEIAKEQSDIVLLNGKIINSPLRNINNFIFFNDGSIIVNYTNEKVAISLRNKDQWSQTINNILNDLNKKANGFIQKITGNNKIYFSLINLLNSWYAKYYATKSHQ